MTKIEWLTLAKRYLGVGDAFQAEKCINEVIELIKIDEQPIQTSGYITATPNWTAKEMIDREG